MGISGTLAVMGAVYYIGTGIQAVAGAAATWLLLAILAALYLWLLRIAARHPDLPQDIDINHPVRPQPWPTVRAGLYFLIPIGILVWCLSVEELSAGLSAFWAAMAMLFQMVTQRPLIAWFRKQPAGPAWRQGWRDAVGGLEEGARNMIGLAIACGTAGLIVGAITLTGLGLRMTAFVELVSMGNVLVMLFFTAAVCLVLGLGMPTTANYILMATLMAPVVVELGAQSGMVIPLIAVHMFVFYYGIMADITPPVGLATFAAAAISGEDPIKTGIQGVTYAARTAILPFMFVFNPMLLLIDVSYGWELALVVAGATLASLTFAAATMRWFRTRCTLLEVGVLLLVTFMLFRPDWFMDHFAPRHESRPASEMQAIAAALPDNGRLTQVLRGINPEGDELTKTVAVALPELASGADAPDAGRKRMAEAGLTLMSLGDQTQIGGSGFRQPRAARAAGNRAGRGGSENAEPASLVRLVSTSPALPLLLAGMRVRQAGVTAARRPAGCARILPDPADQSGCARRQAGHAPSGERAQKPLHRPIGVPPQPPGGQRQLRRENGHRDDEARQGRHRGEQPQAPGGEEKGADHGLHQVVGQRHAARRREPGAEPRARPGAQRQEEGRRVRHAEQRRGQQIGRQPRQLPGRAGRRQPGSGIRPPSRPAPGSSPQRAQQAQRARLGAR